MQILKPIPERSSSTNEPTFMHGGGTYLLMSSNWSSWVYSGYEGSISSDKDPNKTQSSHKSQFRHVKFYSKQIFDEVNRIGISKIAGGDNHMFLLLNNGDAFGYGWNEYTQLLTSTVKNIDTDSCDQFMKCHLHQIQDIYCGANFSYALVKENSQEFQMYSAGWNNDRCLCHGVNGDGSSRPLGKVYCSDENNQVMLFPPSHEHVLSVSCAGCSVAALTVHRLNPKKKKVYRCGAFTGFPRPNTEHSTYGCLNFTTVKNVEILSGAVSIALCSGSIVVLCEDLSAFILGKEIKLSIPIRKAFQLETSCVYMTEDYKIYNCVNVNSIDTSKDVKWSESNSNSEHGSQFETLHARGSRAIGVLSDRFDAIIYDQMDQSQFERVSLLEMLSADDQFRLLRSKSLEMQVVCCRSCSFVFIKPIKKSDPMRRKLLLQTQTLDNPFVDVVIVWN